MIACLRALVCVVAYVVVRDNVTVVVMCVRVCGVV